MNPVWLNTMPMTIGSEEAVDRELAVETPDTAISSAVELTSSKSFFTVGQLLGKGGSGRVFRSHRGSLTVVQSGARPSVGALRAG